MKRIIKSKKGILLIIGFLVIIGLSVWLLLSRSALSDIEKAIRSYGSFGPLVFICLYVLSVVVSPVSGAPLLIAGIAIFGPLETFIYAYSSNLIGATFNFFIARKFGRPLVTKLAGRKNMNEIDEIAQMIGVRVLIIFRLLGGGSFDFVSYAAGLTSMNFYVYFLITALGLIPSSLIFYYTLSQAVQLPLIYSLPAFILILILLVVLPAIMYKYQKKKLKLGTGHTVYNCGQDDSNQEV